MFSAVPVVVAAQKEGILQCSGNNKVADPGAAVAPVAVMAAILGVADLAVVEAVNRPQILKNCCGAVRTV